jgi:hypothetical protein
MAINPNSNPEVQDEEWEILAHDEQEEEGEGQEEGQETEPAVEEEVEEQVQTQEQQAGVPPSLLTDVRQDNQESLHLVVEEENATTTAKIEESENITGDDGKEEERTPFLTTNNDNHQSKDDDSRQCAPPATENREESSSSSQTNDATPSIPFSSGGFLGSSLRLLGDAAKDLDERHHIRRKTRNSWKTIRNESQRGLDTIGDSARRASQKLQQEVERLQIDEKAKVVESQAKIAAEKLAETAKTAGQKVKTLNEEHKVTDILAAVAVIGAGLLLAKGNGRAGATVLASGGAAYMAGEAMRTPYRHDSDLNENIGHHL